MGLNISFSNKTAYTFIAVGVLVLLAIGINAYGGNNPTVMGHSAGELNLTPLYIAGSNIGIGNSNPQARLDVGGGNVNILYNGGNPYLALGDTISSFQFSLLYWDSAANRLRVRVYGGSAANFSDALVFHSNGFVGINQTNPTATLDVGGDGRFSGALTALGGTVWTSSNDGSGSGLDADKLDGKNNGELNAKYVNGSLIKVIPGSPNPRICVQGFGCTLNSGASCISGGGWNGKTACTIDSECNNYCTSHLSSASCGWNCNGDDYSQCSGGTQTSGSEACTTVSSAQCEQIGGIGYCFCDYNGGSHTYAQEGLANSWYCANTTVE